MLDPSGFDLSIGKEWTLRALGAHDTLVPVIFQMQWSLIDAPSDTHFITSDNPVTVMAFPDNDRPQLAGVGFGTPDAQVTMPLTSTVCWIGHWTDQLPGRFTATKTVVKQLNVTRAVHAERFIFGPKFDPGIRRLNRKYADSRMGMSIFGFGPNKRPRVELRRGR